MVDQDRRSVEELVTRYRFQPEMRDLFVEGPRDVSVFRWFFSRLPGCKAVVYDINTVEVTAATCESVGIVGGGNRGRIISLAKFLDQQLLPQCRSVLCCIDRDFDDLENEDHRNRYLVYTDFSCLECYALSTKSLSKVFDIYLGIPITRGEIASIMEVLSYIFSVRLAKRRLAPDSARFGKFTACCSLNNGRIYLDEKAYLARVMNVAAGSLRADSFDAGIKELREKSPSDRRFAVHGHDAVHLLSWLARQNGAPRDVSEESPMHRTMLASLEIEDLRDEGLFNELSNCACHSP
jgi:Protein of unknown function (DUF4435)